MLKLRQQRCIGYCGSVGSLVVAPTVLRRWGPPSCQDGATVAAKSINTKDSKWDKLDRVENEQRLDLLLQRQSRSDAYPEIDRQFGDEQADRDVIGGLPRKRKVCELDKAEY